MRKKVRKAKKIFTGLLSAMLALSAVNASGWGVMNAKAEETTKMGSYSYDQNGFGEGDEVYQPAVLTTDMYDMDGDGQKDAVYEISNAGQLYWFAGLVNGTLSGETKNISANAALTADIVVNENVLTSDGTLNEGSFKKWTPVGSAASPYNGIFEGKSHTISGLYFGQDTEDYAGLFGSNSGNISNVGILDSYFCGRYNIGGVSGDNSGTITSCYNTGSVSGKDHVGGVSGYNSKTITNCYNTGNISGGDSVGGVSGYDDGGIVTNCYNTGNISGGDSVGGVSGYNSDLGGTITDCYNTGGVSGASSVGGVSGDNSKTITNCYNTGNISGGDSVGGVSGDNFGTITNCHNIGGVSGGDSVGGVSGDNSRTITNCYNTGSVKGTGDNVGGVSGDNGNKDSGVTITNCYSTNSVSGRDFVGGVSGRIYLGTTTNCYNAGSVSGTGDNVGGVSGESVKAITTNCCYNSDFYTGNAIGKNTEPINDEIIEGKTTEQFKTGEVAYLLQLDQSEEVWGQAIGTDTYPTLGGAKVYKVAIYKGCEGKPGDAESYVYSNTDKNIYGEHQYTDKDGICSSCGVAYQPAMLTNDRYDMDGDGNMDAVYEISNAGQLYWFAGLVNGTLSGESKNVSANAVLTADIVVNKNVLNSDGTLNAGSFKEWTPIGKTYSAPYNGIFDGQNHTISGLYFGQETEERVGLFGSNSGKISNIGILDSYFYGKNSVGGVSGCNVGTITNCYYTGNVDCKKKQVGGVSGYNYGTITNCYNAGNVSGNNNVGGLSGDNYGTITNCYNAGNVRGRDSYAGGVSGYNYRGTITNCYNADNVSGSYYVGGVSGYNGEGTIIDCYNAGDVSGSYNVGGASGINGEKGYITNCYSSGNVSGRDYVGGVSGYNYGTITNCYYDSTIYTGNAIGINDEGTITKVEGKTTEQYKTGEVAYLLQSDQSEEVWGQAIGTDNYPTLGGAMVYMVATYKGCEGEPGDKASDSYSNTEKDIYGDHPDADNDGKCDSCGAIIDGIGAKLAGYSLSLTGNIGVNFYMELSNQIIADEKAYMQFTLPNGTVTKVPVSEAQKNTTINAEKTYYRFPCEVASYEMTQDIKAQMFDGNGKCGKEYTYTVRDYAQYIIEDSSLYAEAIPFAIAMLNYGACSQKYFNRAVDDLANKNLSFDEQEIPDRFEGYINGFVAKKAENEVLGQFAGLSMVLKSETTLNLFYEPKEGVDVSKLTFLVDGKEITPVKRGQYYILSLKNIKANELGNSKTFTVTDGTNTLSGNYCALMYCYQVLNASEGTYADDLVTLVKAFSDYAYTAKSVCGSN